MGYNVCDNCGAKDGRAGVLVGNADGTDNWCKSCRTTKKTGEVSLYSYLPRTTEEIEKIVKLLK